jgi:hypothetical protein
VNSVPPPSGYPHFVEPDQPSASCRPRRTASSSALQRSCPTTATATSGGGANSGARARVCRYASSRVQRVRELDPSPPRHFPYVFGAHARTCCVRSSFFHRTPTNCISIHQLTLNLSLPFLSVPFTHTSLGYNHSDKVGQINSLNDVLGYAPGQRMLDYIAVTVEPIRSPSTGT